MLLLRGAGVSLRHVLPEHRKSVGGVRSFRSFRSPGSVESCTAGGKHQFMEELPRRFFHIQKGRHWATFWKYFHRIAKGQSIHRKNESINPMPDNVQRIGCSLPILCRMQKKPATKWPSRGYLNGSTCSEVLEIHVLLEVHSSGLATIGVLRPILGRIVPCQEVSILKGLIMWVCLMGKTHKWLLYVRWGAWWLISRLSGWWVGLKFALQSSNWRLLRTTRPSFPFLLQRL